MCRLILTIASTLILIGLTTPPSRADLTVTLDNVTLASGGTGMMNISITSDANDTLSSFGLELMISPVGMPASTLTFTESQADPMGNPNYVFPTQSTDVTLNNPFWSDPATTAPTYNSTTITGCDEDNFGNSYVFIPSINGEPGTYLATVQFASPMGAPAGDQFQISLVPNAGETYFDDQYGDPLSYSVVGGLVTIAPSVPEPSTLVLTLVGLGGSLGLWWRRRSRSPVRAIG